MSNPLGPSGQIARTFLSSELTPLIALVGLLLGLFAIAVTPREEEPQINVTFANIFIAFPGASAREVEHLISVPAEQILSEIDGVKHVYSVSQPGRAVLTVQYEVGENRTEAIVRLYNAVYSKQDWLPADLGAAQPLIKPKGIDDVPILALTLWSEDPRRGAHELLRVAHAVEAELKRVNGTRDIYTLGGPERVVHVQLDAARLAGFGLTVDDLDRALRTANRSQRIAGPVTDNHAIEVQAGEFFSSASDIAALVVGLSDGRPVYLRDVAEVRDGPDQPEQYVRFGHGPASAAGGQGSHPAVTLAVAKKPGTNAVKVASEVIERFEQLRGVFVPEGIHMTVTRNYGQTAADKAQTLIGKLVFATSFVVLLVLFALGYREALIVGTAVVITLLLTLFASWAIGFTLNRVSLFALIFSIGILVDDAIVVVENIHRHRQLGGGSLLQLIPRAVDEVGGPTILATLTVIAALMPMTFVSGLMGPYMSPIPINASIGMAISLAVAFVITPWLYRRIMGDTPAADHAAEDKLTAGIQGLLARYMPAYLRGDTGKPKRRRLMWIMVLLVVLSVALIGIRVVVLKMLPFDNKSEFQVVVDMPEGTAVERTAAVLDEMAAYIASVPEVTDYQVYAGTAAPINFNGLVRQYYLRRSPHLGDIQVNLSPKDDRDRKSHDIARAVRPSLQAIATRHSARVKIVEVPPGPPVQAPLVAEIYGLDYDGQIGVARKVREVFAATADIVDVDDSVEYPAARWVLQVDRNRATLLGVSQQQVVAAVSAALDGRDATYLHSDTAKYPVPVRLELPVADKAGIDTLLALHVRGRDNRLVPLSEFVSLREATREAAVYHKDLLRVVFVTGDMAGRLDSPLYGMFAIHSKLKSLPTDHATPLAQTFIEPPDNPYRYSLKWDGEWQITYETFRDMGIAYAVGMILIYILVVAQFRSYVVPLIIMAPIPLTVIGVMPGHALFGAQFTATSMIGMIALAGIIVRNSILLVDFINQKLAEGLALEDAVIQSGAVRAKPILLTALAAMLGALFILDDPIFNGLAISLIFGILVSTLLTLVVIPVMYYAYLYRRRDTAA